MDHFIETFFRFDFLAEHWPAILKAFILTLQMAASTLIIGLPLGLLLAVLRLYKIRPLTWLIIFYIDFFRAIPALVIIVLVYFALPSAGITLSPVNATVFSMAFVLSAVSEEVFWGALQALTKGQWEAGRSTGLGFHETLIFVILPQVVRLSVPSLTNRSIGITKGTTLGAVVAVPELLSVTSSLQSNLGNPSLFTLGAILYLIIFLPFVQLTRWLERHLEKGRA